VLVLVFIKRLDGMTATRRSNSGNTTDITIMLSQADLFSIKSTELLAVSLDTVYLTVEDVPPLTWSTSKRPIDFPVRVVGIKPTKALAATRFVPDTTAPYLRQYTIDANTGMLVSSVLFAVNDTCIGVFSP